MLKKIVAVVVVSGSCRILRGLQEEGRKAADAGRTSGHGRRDAASRVPCRNMPKVDRTVVVSKEVAAKWKAVKLAVENKAAKTTKEYTVNVGSELAIPNTKMKVKVLAFLPDFKMGDKEFTSASDKPNMPAAQVSVTENGKEIWNNWLFSMQPGDSSVPA